MKKQSQVLTGPPAPTERNPAGFNQACPLCGWESEEVIEGCATKFAKCPKCGNEMDQPFIINTAPNELELLTPQVAEEKQVNKQGQTVQKTVDVNTLSKVLVDQGVDPSVADQAARLVDTQTKAKNPEKPQSAVKPAQPGMKPVSNRLKKVLNDKKAWGDGPGRINFGPDYVPPRMAEADEKSEIDLVHADEPEMSAEEIKNVGAAIGIDWSNSTFSPEDLLAGYTVELEHGTRDEKTNVTDNDPEKTAKIAWAHLNEDPKYYQKLKKMEQTKHEIQAFLKKRAITIRELQKTTLPNLEEHLFNIAVALQNSNPTGAQESLNEAFALFTIVRDKVDSLGDVDPVTYGTEKPVEKKKPNWFERLIEPD